MPMIARGQAPFRKRRILVSGLPNRGKTWSIPTFCEGEEHLVILSCPGETGTLSLPEDTTAITSYYFEGEGVRTVEWCRDALSDFDRLYKEIEKNAPDKLFIDGAHNLFEMAFNIITGGLYFAGVDLKASGNSYTAADFYRRGYTTFGNRLKTYYDSPIPFVGVTTWERLLGARTGDEGGATTKINIADDRYWWPSIPGDMATKVVGFFDAQISARLEKRCIHSTCEYSKRAELHHVWQFYPKNDVMGVGIKGLQVTDVMKQKPWIHQTWPALRTLLSRAQ